MAGEAETVAASLVRVGDAAFDLEIDALHMRLEVHWPGAGQRTHRAALQTRQGAGIAGQGKRHRARYALIGAVETVGDRCVLAVRRHCGVVHSEHAALALRWLPRERAALQINTADLHAMMAATRAGACVALVEGAPGASELPVGRAVSDALEQQVGVLQGEGGNHRIAAE